MPAIYVAVNAGGNTLTVYLTGIGLTHNTTLHNATYPWSATVGGKSARALFLGAAPLLLGVYQANIEVPADLMAGDYPLAITVNGVTSRDVIVSLGAQ